tara:strand:+ start:724 stop:1755 length:1032 start_codon:yes stop_codon:yes gene_type:complete
MSSINYETDSLFRNLIINILKLGNLKTKTINLLLDSEYKGYKGIQHYGFAFTHKSIDENNNYESYEFKGDSTANNCLVWYFSRRFPELNTTDNVKTLARLKINYGSKKMFYTLGDKLGMWDYITAGTETRIIKNKKKVGNSIVNVEIENVIDIKQTKKKSLLEDCFEAFIGVTQILLDEFVKNGMGYKICYNIISKLYDDLEIKLDHASLYDPKTRLKELFDKYCDKFGKWGKDNVKAVQYKNRYSEFGKWRVTVGYNIRTSDNKMEQLREMLELYMYDDRLKGDIIMPNHILNFVDSNFVENNKPTYKFVELGFGEASLKDDAEQMACENALHMLERDGFKK